MEAINRDRRFVLAVGWAVICLVAYTTKLEYTAADILMGAFLGYALKDLSVRVSS